MHWQLAALALVLLGFAAISGRIEGTWITAPMVFTAAGLVVGVEALGPRRPVRDGHRGQDPRRGDAHGRPLLRRVAHRPARAQADARDPGAPARNRPPADDRRRLRRRARAARRARLAGGAASLAIILAPTDAALGQAVVTSPRLPVRVRQSLNVESGLNDGICVPLFLVALADRAGGGGRDRGRRGRPARRSRRSATASWRASSRAPRRRPSSSTRAAAAASTRRGSRSSRSPARFSRSASPRRSAAPASSPRSSAG